MKTATYYTPDAPPRVYPCREGAVEGTIDLLSADGRAIVTGLPLVTQNAPTLLRAYGVLVSVEKQSAGGGKKKKDFGRNTEPLTLKDPADE
jgi:hypothetical protein